MITSLKLRSGICLILVMATIDGNRVLGQGMQRSQNVLPENIIPLEESARPWVFWYWMQASFSKEGITADLEAMKEVGIGGAYLAPIKGKATPPLYEPVIEQLTPEWWKMVDYAFREAHRLGIKIAMLPNDGFATAGGPWITPALSMQKVVSSFVVIKGNRVYNGFLPAPPSYQGYYRDIAILAFPVPSGTNVNSYRVRPRVTTSTGSDASFLAIEGNKKNFGSTEPCWIQYAFEKPFTCRSIAIHVNNYNYQSNRLIIEASSDGKTFARVGQLEPPRAGWLDWDADVTHEIVPTTARYFRFVYNRAGSEPGAEDLDAAKWKQSLKIAGIELSSQPRIHQFEGKTGEVWRVSRRTTSQELPDSLCVPAERIVDVTKFVSADGKLKWKAPAGDWMIFRVGYTSTGHMNETAGAGKGLECDKFNPEAVKLQFDKWFGEAVRTAGPELAPRVLSTFHVDSWESGSQNWSPVFRDEFRRRRGYDPILYMPAMAGIPVQSSDISERFLFDIRKTISELITDNFFHTLKQLVHDKGIDFTAETTGPVMAADGMLHFREVDVPMGEFWLRSPSHDKPNDIRDAVSGAHIYGKRVIQAEAFTEVRMNWNECPANLKALQDRNYAFGINRLVYHVFAHNPWMNRKPGMTLNDVGLLFQRDQTWWKAGGAWVEYARRCQSLLQEGVPVVDIAVFTGEETPRRALLPDRVVSSLPGIFGKETVDNERKRLSNEGLPMRELPDGVNTSANIASPENWTDPLHGYSYDSFNDDALIRLAKVKDGRIELPGGASYSILVLPGRHPMQPNPERMSADVASRVLQLVTDGATVVLGERPVAAPGLSKKKEADATILEVAEKLWGGEFSEINSPDGTFLMKRVGSGRVIKGPYQASSFNTLGLMRDLVIKDRLKGKMAWTHRKTADKEIYFISNQDSCEKIVTASFRVNNKGAILYDAVTGETMPVRSYTVADGRVELPLKFSPNGSVFVIFCDKAPFRLEQGSPNWLVTRRLQELKGRWTVQFDPSLGGPKGSVVFSELSDWSTSADSLIRYYSGTASYAKTFKLKKVNRGQKLWLDLGEVANIAQVKVNGVSCGVTWTAPYRAEITGAVREGINRVEIQVTNTWANRLIGDLGRPEGERITHTTATIRLQGKPLTKSGLLGPVIIQTVQE